MSFLNFHHGTRLKEVHELPVLVQVAQTAVVALLGTAPDSRPAIAAAASFGIGNAALSVTAKSAGPAGNAIRLVFADPDSADADLSVTVEDNTINVALATGADKAITTTADLLKTAIEREARANALITLAHTTGSDGSGAVTPGIVRLAGGADEPFPLDTPVLLKGTPAAAAALGNAGTLKDAVDDVFDQIGAYTFVIRVAEGNDVAATLSNLVGDATRLTGVHALKKARPLTGITPRLIAIPGFTSASAEANPVVAELPGILDELRATAFVDGPDTTDEAAIAYRKRIGSQRIYVVDPKVKVWSTATNAYVSRPASARFAGVQARVDIERGFWHSLSNKKIHGIGGVSRTINYGKHANLLNENHVGTIINMGAGFITWGNRSTTDTDLWRFLSVRRTADFINEAMEEAYLEYVDDPFSAAAIKFMLESGNAAMRNFKAQGAILGGRVWIDPENNDPTEMAAGKITLSLEFEPPAPMEDIRFLAHRNIQYYLELTREALRAAA